MTHLTSFYSHARAVQEAAAAAGLQATARLSDFALELRGPGDEDARVWQARFVASIQGRLCYAPRPGDSTIGFAGWMPYTLRQWPIALDKIAFKRHAIGHAIPTPAACFDPALIRGPFLIKQATSSFGEGIRGPYREFDPSDEAQRLRAGEYYENFIPGWIAKAWCWGEQCFALHLHQPSVVTGDGQSSLRQLIRQLPDSRDGRSDWARIDVLARYCGLASADAAVPEGKEVLVEFRYGSRYERGFGFNPNLMEQAGGAKLRSQFEQAAHTLAPACADGGEATPSLYTLDAMVDGDGEASFLEMNCNPIVHPAGYAAMVVDLCARRPPLPLRIRPYAPAAP